MKFIVKFTNKDDGGILQEGFKDSNEEELEDDILQLVQVTTEGEEIVWAEYTHDEFNC